MLYVGPALLLLLLALDLFASRSVLRLDYTREQKLLQLALVWLLPLIGACLVLAVAHLQHSEEPSEASDEDYEEDVPGPIVDPGD